LHYSSRKGLVELLLATFFYEIIIFELWHFCVKIGSDTWQTRRSLSLKRNYKMEIIRDPHWLVIKAYHDRVNQCKVKIMPRRDWTYIGPS